MNLNQYFPCGKHCETVQTGNCCRTLILQEILKTKNLLQVETLRIFGSHTFVPISWMCKKQTSVSHSSTESDIISLDAGLTHGWEFTLLIFGIWLFKCSILLPTNSQAQRECTGRPYCVTHHQAMVIKGRSPTMRHLSRTHQSCLGLVV